MEARKGRSPLHIAPHVAHFDRFSVERNVVHFHHDGAYIERPPPKVHTILSRDIFDSHHGQIGVSAADRKPKFDA